MMTRRWWRRIGPWATPLLVAVEVVLVWSGLLQVGTAVWVGVAIEALLWVTAASRAVVAIRLFRAGRVAGVDGWVAAEDALAAVIPRRAAHVLLLEPRLWISLARWVTGRHEAARSAGTFGYDAALRPVLWAVVGVVVVEGAAVEFVLALAGTRTVWLIASMAVHGYAVLGLLGVLASFATRPHLLDGDVLSVRDGVFNELIVPLAGITGVRRVSRSNFGRSGLKIDRAGHALLAHGDATIEITLDPAQPVTVVPTPRASNGPLATLTITTEDPRELIRQVNVARQVEQTTVPVTGCGAGSRGTRGAGRV